MKNKLTHFALSSLLVMIAMVACSSYKNSHKENVAYLYRHEALKLHPIYKVYHESDSVTNVFYQINLTEFEYKKTSYGTPMAKYQIEYMLFEDFKTKKIIDSNAYVLYDSLNYNQNRSTLGIFNVHFPQKVMSNSEDSLFVLKVLLTDLNADHTSTYLIEVDKKDKLGRQNFYLKAKDGFPLMTDYINRDQEFYIVSNDPDCEKLYAKRFKGIFPAAHPPHAGRGTGSSKRLPDSSYSIEMTNGVSPLMKLERQAYYHFYTDSTRKEGLSIYRFTSSYPYVSTPMQMLMPLRYITSNKEFKELLSKKDKEEAVRKFWNEIAGSANRTEELMSDYYSLVTQTNFLFSSDREGWKTDRGMIYIVFGPPNMVFRDGLKETWVYGDIESKLAVKFEFIRVQSPFSSNDYWLNRSTSYGQSWHNAIEIWRR